MNNINNFVLSQDDALHTRASQMTETGLALKDLTSSPERDI